MRSNLEDSLNRNPKMPRNFPDIAGGWRKQPWIVNDHLFPVKKVVGMFDDNLRAIRAQIASAAGAYSAAAWNGPRSPSGTVASASAIAAKSAATCANRGPR